MAGKPFSKELVFASDFIAQAKKVKETYGTTDRHQTGLPELDKYLFGGYGREDNWEIVVLHGGYKVGKSTIGLNMLVGAIKAGTKVGIFALEDDLPNVTYRLALALDDPGMQSKWLSNVRYLPRKTYGRNRWTLQEALEEIENWFTDPIHGVEIILLDHINFLFDAAESNHDYGQWAAQNTFMHDLNDVMDKVKKTIIIVSQQNREKQIAGSIGIPRAASKLIGVSPIEGEGKLAIQLEPSRHTPKRDYVFVAEVRNGRIYASREQPSVSKRTKEF